jgi:hypothetical protein
LSSGPPEWARLGRARVEGEEVTPDQLDPTQRAAFDAIMGFAQRLAMRVVEMPKAQRPAAMRLARDSLEDAAKEHGITDAKFIDICVRGVEVIMAEIENSGSSGSGRI